MKVECVINGFSQSPAVIEVKTSHDRVEFSSEHDFTQILTNPLKTDNGKTIGERNREWLHAKLDAWLDKTWEQE